MASTVTPSTFQVRIKEDHVINGVRTVNENLYRVHNVTNYDRRIVTVPVNTNVDLINTNGLIPGPALFPSHSIAYGRITNMDDSNRLAVSFTSSRGESGNISQSYWTMECLPTSSIMFSSPNCSGSSFNGSFEQDIEFISVYALTGSVDVEYVIVNAPISTN
tara:strand:+ start:2519 stop:3004 length:486 start_codon:yes stop_codon:yes gene_type:complete